MANQVQTQTSFHRRLLKWFLRGMILLILGFVALAGILYFEIHRADGTLISGGKKRTYLLHVPKAYQPGHSVPLVICLHGFAEWPAHLMRLSHWNQVADESGFLVVYPSGSGFPLRWHANGPFGNAAQAGQDVRFISDLIDHLRKDYSIDTDRVYANGLSNGGGMSFLLAAELSERIAAFGSVGGAYCLPWKDYRPKRPVPAIVFHGTSDPIVPFHGRLMGRVGVPFPDIPEWVQALAAHNGCQASPVPLPASGAVSGLRYPGGATNAEVILYTIAGGGHTWPGGKKMPAFITGRTSMDVDATRLMWGFFEQHPLRR
jgi:polyhydroxybutyrate depolymerase